MAQAKAVEHGAEAGAQMAEAERGWRMLAVVCSSTCRTATRAGREWCEAGQARTGRAVWHSFFRPGRPMRRHSSMGCQMRHPAAIGKLRVGIWRLAVEQRVPLILPPLQPPPMVLSSIECSQ